MEQMVYWLFSAAAVGGAMGLVFSRGYVNSVMSMLLSMLGMAGMLFMMGAFFLAFVMLVVYAGAVMVLFVFVVMLVGEERDGASWRRRAATLGLWALLCAAAAYFAASLPDPAAAPGASEALAGAAGYGRLMFTKFMPMFEIAGAVLLSAMVGIIATAKEPSPKRPKRDML